MMKKMCCVPQQHDFWEMEVERTEGSPLVDSNKRLKRRICKLHSEISYEKLQAEISDKQKSLQAAASEVKSLTTEIDLMETILKDPSDSQQLRSTIIDKQVLLDRANTRKENLQAEIAKEEESMETSPAKEKLPPDEIAELKAKIAKFKRQLQIVITEENALQTDIFTLEKVRDNFGSSLDFPEELRQKNWEDEIASKKESLKAAVAHTKKLKAEIADKKEKLQDETANKGKSSLPTFGPLYTKYESSIWTGKETAWNHVLRRTQNSRKSETIEIYLQAMRKIEEDARQTYEEGAVDHLTGSEFRWMMIKDGCFLLQLALFYLGGSHELEYPSEDLIFGEKSDTKNVKKWIKSMFFVGNQIPLIVLEELMKQDFFQQVVKSKQKWELPSDLAGQVLYQLLLLPALAGRNLTLCAALSMAFPGRDQINFYSHKPSDPLHGLHLLVLGQGRDYGPEYRREDGDLEAGHRLEDSSNDDNEVSSATELKQAGISFTSVFVERKGIRGITFKDCMFQAALFLPKLMVDEDTELLFQNLRDYEITQKLGSSKREVGSYLQFMSELIRTPEDAELLVPCGIIKGSPSQREKLPAILSRLASKDTSQSLRLIRLRVRNYSRPTWEKFRNFFTVIFLLTLIQTVYAVVSYHTKKN